jgi:hypothetical protein
MLIFLIVNILYFKEKIANTKNIGIAYVMVNCMAAAALGMLPVSETFFAIRLEIVGVILGIVVCSLLVFGRVFQMDIVMFVCRV